MEVERGGAPGPYIGKRKCGSRTIGIMMSSVGEGEPQQMECVEDGWAQRQIKDSRFKIPLNIAELW